MSFTTLKFALRNLGRNPKRTLLAWCGIAVAQTTLVWLGSFMNGHEKMIFNKLTGPMLGHFQVHAKKYREDSAIERTISPSREVVEEIQNQYPNQIKGISPRIYGPVLATAQELGHVAVVTGLDLPLETQPMGLLEGFARDHGQSEVTLLHLDEVLIGKNLAEEMNVHVNDQLALMGQAADGSIASGLYRVKGLVQTDVDQINRTGIIMALASAQDLFFMDNQVHELAIRTDQPEVLASLVSNLRANPKLSSYEILDWKELVPQLAAFLEMSDKMNLIILVLIFLTTTAGIANTMLMATFERSHEFGMLLALGCKPKKLILILLSEAVALGISGVLIGSLLGSLLVIYEMRHGISLFGFTDASNVTLSVEGLNLGTKLYPILRVGDLFRGILAVLITAILATLWPARRISRLEPIEAMRQ